MILGGELSLKNGETSDMNNWAKFEKVLEMTRNNLLDFHNK